VMVAYSGWLVYRGHTPSGGIDLHILAIRWSGFLLTVGAGCGLATLESGQANGLLPAGAGGVLGNVIGQGLVELFSPIGATLFLLALFLAGVTLFTGLSWLSAMDFTGKYTLMLADNIYALVGQLPEYIEGRRALKKREEAVRVSQQKAINRRPPRIEPVVRQVERSERQERERQVPLFDPPPNTELPPLSLLDEPRPSEEGYSAAALEAMSRLVEMKLLDFNIEVEVVAVHPGPVITRFELDLGAGVKVSQVSNLAKDIARALSAISVRVVEVIPGKSVIGLEIPNEHREIVSLSEILGSAEYDDSSSPLTLALGKDIGGEPIVVDLARMPHLLVAGTTGSGKSVAINAMVLSLLYKTLPKDVRLIMIDPKMLELSVYEGIPHLLTPVVTDMNEAANALRWCVAEMERRYRLMAALGVRNIANYNRKVKEAEEEGEPIPDPLFNPEEALEGTEHPVLQPLPFIVIVIDELADMMMVVGKKVEELIARLAQKARASGVHLILATQRPSVDVITGLIKANIPTRIAFQVSSKIDSRTILDQMGAEQLLGHGDMLYMAPGTSVPVRVHGAFVSDTEVHKVAAHLKGKSEPEYMTEILEASSDPVPGLSPANGGGDSDTETDPLYDQAVALVTESRRASISGVQRRLKIGYNRAARMIEHMEETGIVGPLQSNGSREVLAGPPPEA
ncbi:MAG: DNA translocase FtsK 4TM domain-containing protein, partial [Gammaproteobacteria bacterium]|nr:DNA translocase FtsK 4TM domain-containing protein [Gammaproteobacteria bacterium]